jgi:hypothetical protein
LNGEILIWGGVAILSAIAAVYSLGKCIWHGIRSNAKVSEARNLLRPGRSFWQQQMDALKDPGLVWREGAHLPETAEIGRSYMRGLWFGLLFIVMGLVCVLTTSVFLQKAGFI